jgi:hypothetical protein
VRNLFKPCIFIFISVAVLQPVFSASLEELVGSGQAAALRTATEPVTEVQTRNPSPRLLPRHGGLVRYINELQGDLGPNILVENLSLYPKPTLRESAGWTNDEQIGLLNQMLALSTLTGIQYYSASRGHMRVFYETSQVINNPVDKTPRPDPVYNTLPDFVTLYARQKDLTFGDNIYRYDYHTTADYILFMQENVTPMTTGIINAVGRNRFRMVTAIIDLGDSLLIYAAAMAKATSIPGIGDRVGASFTNRAKAILKWFAERANTVF